MPNKEINVSPEKVLEVAHQQLRACFFESTKVFAKQTFNDLQDGKKVPLIEIASPDMGEVTGLLALDCSDFVGKLNYSIFRDALASHLRRTAEKLQAGESLNIFTNKDSGALLFHIPGLVQVDEQVNILVTGIEQSRPGEIIIKLMFLHPDNFKTN